MANAKIYDPCRKSNASIFGELTARTRSGKLAAICDVSTRIKRSNFRLFHRSRISLDHTPKFTAKAYYPEIVWSWKANPKSKEAEFEKAGFEKAESEEIKDKRRNIRR